jgi:hypothetical protein
MIAIFYVGVALALAGLAGIGWFIRRARALRRAELDDHAVQAEVRSLVALNVGAFGLAFLGLAMAVVGLILA